MGPSYDQNILNWPAVTRHDKAQAIEAPLHRAFKKYRHAAEKKILGPDLLSQFISIRLVNEPSSFLVDPVSAELEVNISKSIIALNCGEGKEAEHEQEEIEEEDTLEKSKKEEGWLKYLKP